MKKYIRLNKNLYKGGYQMVSREPTFDIDIYKKPKLLSEKESVAQIILKPGNLPDNPDLGVDIEQYMYVDSDLSIGETIRTALIKTCGRDLVTANINNVSFITRKQEEDNSYVFLMQINISFKGDDKSTNLGIGGYQKSGSVTYNWDYLDSNYKNI